MGYKSHPIGNTAGMISLVFALVIEHGEKKNRDGKRHGGGVEKINASK